MLFVSSPDSDYLLTSSNEEWRADGYHSSLGTKQGGCIILYGFLYNITAAFGVNCSIIFLPVAIFIQICQRIRQDRRYTA